MEVVCLSCGRTFIRNSRNKNQSYCSRPECQKKRKSLWQRRKMTHDENYRLNHKASQKGWTRSNPGYWKEYRRRNPEKAQRNRELQVIRNLRRRKPDLIAKMDALIVNMFCDNDELCVIAKKDSIAKDAVNDVSL